MPITLYITNINDWKAISETLRKAEIEWNELKRKKPGDEFSRIIMGTANWAENFGMKKDLMKLLASTKLIIGIPDSGKFQKLEQNDFSCSEESAIFIFDGNSLNFIRG